MHTQASQCEAGDYEDSDIHEDADHAARSGAEGKEEEVGVEFAPPPRRVQPTSLSGFYPPPFTQQLRSSTATTTPLHLELSSRPIVAPRCSYALLKAIA